MFSLLLALTACNQKEIIETPEDATHWNPQDLSDGLMENDVPGSRGESLRFYGTHMDDTVRHTGYEKIFELSFDASAEPLGNESLIIQSALFSESIFCDRYEPLDENGEVIETRDECEASSQIYFQVSTNQADHCEITIDRSSELYAVDNPQSFWSFKYFEYGNGEIEEKRNNHYTCWDETPVEVVTENICELLTP